jgi:hypothetical protein
MSMKWKCMLLLGAGALVGLTGCARPGGGVDALRPVALAQPSCTASALRLSVVGTDTAVGTTVLTVAVTSDSTDACTLQGYPTLGVLEQDGRPSAVTVGHGAGPMFAGAATPVTVSSAGGASFYLAYRTIAAATGEACPARGGLRVALPGLPGESTVDTPLAPCGAVTVSALRPGTDRE